ncbi:hypothetical protein Q4574_05160 [Aliiglaciecola sp. 3_MG-2023]|uniref:hypothetical protein n=1 Tax=Aliiglaciecola sp. 3_MG-2023 TaxID=3062644 RepID=UPI0026E3DE7C|nr:hypothetical protein [Aliiglaciecola sp. 3_MG-2023]MDO6692659.1 hypothetical protein [Aliiglaciecola sp. 3_MG-2023]
MKYVLFVLLFVSYSAFSKDELKQVYLSFESDYMSNNGEDYSKWLTDQYEIVQTMHIPNLGSDSRRVTGKQMLESMKKMNKPNATPSSTLENTRVHLKDDSRFCATSTTVTHANISGTAYEEKETRKVCFIKIMSEFKASEHKIDVYYKAL